MHMLGVVQAVLNLDITCTQKCIMMYLAFRMKEGADYREARWESQTTVGKAISLNRVTILRNLKKLTAQNLIEIDKGKTTNLMRFHVNFLDTVAFCNSELAGATTRAIGTTKIDEATKTGIGTKTGNTEGVGEAKFVDPGETLVDTGLVDNIVSVTKSHSDQKISIRDWTGWSREDREKIEGLAEEWHDWSHEGSTGRYRVLDFLYALKEIVGFYQISATELRAVFKYIKNDEFYVNHLYTPNYWCRKFHDGRTVFDWALAKFRAHNRFLKEKGRKTKLEAEEEDYPCIK